MQRGKKRPATVLVAYRVPVDLAERLDALARDLSTPWHAMKRSALARIAMERGLEAMLKEAATRRAAAPEDGTPAAAPDVPPEP
jgi:hypothetical protein